MATRGRGALTEQVAERQDGHHVDGHHEPSEHPVDEGAVDDEVDVPQAVAQARDRDAERQRQHGDGEQDVGATLGADDLAHAQEGQAEHGAPDDPLRLLALLTDRATQAEHQRG